MLILSSNTWIARGLSRSVLETGGTKRTVDRGPRTLVLVTAFTAAVAGQRLAHVLKPGRAKRAGYRRSCRFVLIFSGRTRGAGVFSSVEFSARPAELAAVRYRGVELLECPGRTQGAVCVIVLGKLPLCTSLARSAGMPVLVLIFARDADLAR